METMEREVHKSEDKREESDRSVSHEVQRGRLPTAEVKYDLG